MTEDEMVEWHHRFNGHEFEKAPEIVMDREAWHPALHGATEVDTTEQLNAHTQSVLMSHTVCN